MRYPSYNITGPISPKQELGIRCALQLLGCIETIPEGHFYFNGIYHELQPGYSLIPATNVTPDEFVTKLVELKEQVDNFINSLVPGSKVVICECDTNPNDYPCYFTENMFKFVGQKITINRIITNDRYLGQGRRFYNHSNIAYHIAEDDGQFFWHSSMFELPDTQPTEKLIISELNVNPLIIN